MWPDHCVQGSKGAEYHPDLLRADTDIEVLKGQDKMIETYSAFSGAGYNTGLADILRAKQITKVYCVGLVYDYCVGYTAESAFKEGFETFIIPQATRSSFPESEAKMKAKLTGIKEINLQQL